MPTTTVSSYLQRSSIVALVVLVPLCALMPNTGNSHKNKNPSANCKGPTHFVFLNARLMHLPQH